MTHLFFIDESGHDRRQMPYEIHGGILVPLTSAWSLIRAIKDAQIRLFGSEWASFEVELKGERLLQKRIFQFAEGRNKKRPDAPPPTFSEDERREFAGSFMRKGFEELQAKREGKQLSLPRTAQEFCAYGRACIDLVDAVFQACVSHDVIVFAAVVDPQAPRPPAPQWNEMLRKDLVYLFERIYYFMETLPRGAMAVSVFDQKDDLSSPRCVEGQRLNDCLARYFTRSHTGRLRSSRILPEPLFARSDLTTLLGAADLAIYVINHGYRPASWVRPAREEIRQFEEWINRLRWRGRREDYSPIYGIVLMDDLRPRGGGA